MKKGLIVVLTVFMTLLVVAVGFFGYNYFNDKEDSKTESLFSNDNNIPQIEKGTKKTITKEEAEQILKQTDSGGGVSIEDFYDKILSNVEWSSIECVNEDEYVILVTGYYKDEKVIIRHILKVDNEKLTYDYVITTIMVGDKILTNEDDMKAFMDELIDAYNNGTSNNSVKKDENENKKEEPKKETNDDKKDNKETKKDNNVKKEESKEDTTKKSDENKKEKEEPKKTEKYYCKDCGREIDKDQYNDWQRCPDCARTWDKENNKVEYYCKYCGRGYYLEDSDAWDPQTFCSKECSMNWEGQQHEEWESHHSYDENGMLLPCDDHCGDGCE